MNTSALYGLLAEFDDAETLSNAVSRLRDAGYRRLEAYSPYPVDGLAERLGRPPRVRLAKWTLVGGLIGATLAYTIQYYSAVIDYPVNIGGRPLHSWPAFIPMTIEFGFLGAALGATVALLVAARLPRKYHPLFRVAPFTAASRDRFFVCVRADDPRFDRGDTAQTLGELTPLQVHEVAS